MQGQTTTRGGAGGQTRGPGGGVGVGAGSADSRRAHPPCPDLGLSLQQPGQAGRRPRAALGLSKAKHSTASSCRPRLPLGCWTGRAGLQGYFSSFFLEAFWVSC